MQPVVVNMRLDNRWASIQVSPAMGIIVHVDSILVARDIFVHGLGRLEPVQSVWQPHPSLLERACMKRSIHDGASVGTMLHLQQTFRKSVCHCHQASVLCNMHQGIWSHRYPDIILVLVELHIPTRLLGMLSTPYRVWMEHGLMACKWSASALWSSTMTPMNDSE